MSTKQGCAIYHLQTLGSPPEASRGLLSLALNSESKMGLATRALEFILENEHEIVSLLEQPWGDEDGNKTIKILKRTPTKTLQVF